MFLKIEFKPLNHLEHPRMSASSCCLSPDFRNLTQPFQYFRILHAPFVFFHNLYIPEDISVFQAVASVHAGWVDVALLCIHTSAFP